jgi:trans-2,3-dihydro-3-hydroxyanthranilate isomerase
MTGYLVYDVFTDRPFGGNPLAVIPDASALPEAALQKIAREFNYSETAFVFAPEVPDHTARVRIFTPTQEVPFAGHPTIGTAVALGELGRGRDLVLELGIGPLPCTVDGATARFETRAKLEILHEVAPELPARALSLPVEAIREGCVMASLGLPFVLVELDGPDRLSAIRPVTEAFAEGARRYPSPFDFAVFAWARDGAAVRARMFAPLDDIPEDPATGSACAALAALLARRKGGGVELTVHQGVEMGRPSLIRLRADTTAVRVAGQAVRVMEGRLHL